jgi:hypothetical protein
MSDPNRALDDLKQWTRLAPDAQRALIDELTTFSHDGELPLESLLGALVELARTTDAATLDPLVGKLFRPQRSAAGAREISLSARAASDLATLYGILGDTSRTRYLLLRLFALDGRAAMVGRLADSLVDDPPLVGDDTALAIAPLVQGRAPAAAALFPRLFDAMQHPVLAPLVLDLANFCFRRKITARHPAADRIDQLAALLEAIVARLEQIEVDPHRFAATPQELTHLVGESVALVVSLCDALALAGDDRAKPKLERALALKHRRVRTEAAAALARLGDPEGTTALIELTAQPAVRTRALAYLEELGQLESVPENRRNKAARAEGDLSAWLAEPRHLGLAPSALDLIDSRRMYWPGYEEPVDCFLFRFEYRAGDRTLAGVGISGPVTHSFFCDLQDFAPDDIYAAYAGWSTEHEEIQERPADELYPGERQRWEKLVLPAATEAGYADVVLAKRARFFGREQWVATARRDQRAGVLVVDDGTPGWYPLPSTSRPPGANEILWLHNGRELLAAFNRD